MDVTKPRNSIFTTLEPSVQAPSTLADSAEFNKHKEKLGLVCHRPAEYLVPPVAYSDPILARFQDNTEGAELESEDLVFVLKLSKQMSSLVFDGDSKEAGRVEVFQNL